MSWFQKLHETYEACCTQKQFIEPDQTTDGKEVAALMPVSHVSQQAHICIELTHEGDFAGAYLFPPKKNLIIPTTESSAGRAGKKVAPHPLVDKIHYIASDYKGKKAASFKGGFDLYREQLQGWAESEYTHPLIKAVFAYISKGSVVQDLVKKGILFEDSTRNLLMKPLDNSPTSIFKLLTADAKTKLFDQGDAVVAWRIIGKETQDCWANQSLQDKWKLFYATKESRLC